MKKRYRKKQRRAILLGGATALLIVVLAFLLIYTIVAKKQPWEKDASNISSEEIFDQLSDTTEPIELTVPEQEISITISAVGDCTLGTDENFNYSRSLNKYYELNGPDYFLKNVRDIFQADDLTIVNLEGTFTNSTTRRDKTYAFKGPAEFVNILTGSSVESANIANNHSHDYGDSSFTDTKETLKNAGIAYFGYKDTAIVDVKGVKVGLIGIYELGTHLGCSQQIKDNVAKVKEDGAELIIVSFHWGIERDAAPNSTQITLAHLAIDEGADLVIGHHPHVLQGIEVYKGKNIVYSLGNFCFGGNSNPSDKDTMIFQQTFTLTKDGVKADNVTNIIPCSLSSQRNVNDYKPTPATGDEATRILKKIEDRSALIP